ncbi:BQ2448_7183 [Microbotryum intermedium]|uniref:BQ2448_7183 protein n=1 Tax=Microbotryum intermedium TaxID=269621 RepID=A0A238FPY2_9BASI|nr:BQ2448_7183 [Microbotryum intermedium]
MLPNPSTPNHLSTHLLPPLDETPPIEDAWIFAFEERRMSRDSTPSSPSPIRSSSAFPASATPSSSPTRARERSRPADREGDRVNPNPFEQAVIIDDDEQDWMNQEVSIKEVVPASNLPDIPSFVYHSDPFETAEAEVEVDKEAELERSRPVSSFASSSSSPLTRLAPIATPPRKPSTRRGTLVPLLNVDTCTPARDRPYSAPPTNNRLPFRSSSTTSIPNSAAPFSAIPGPLPKELWAKGSSFSTLSKSSAYLGGKAQDAQRWIVRAAAKGVRGIKSATGSSAKVSKTSLGEEDEGTAELKRKQREREREMEKEEWRVLSVGLQERKIRGRSGSRLVKGRRGVRAKREEQMRRKRMCVWLGVVAGVLVFVLVGVVGLIMHLRMEREHQKGNGINPFDNGDSNATGGGGGGGADGGSVVPSPINHTSPTIVPVLTNSTNLNNPPDPKANPSPTSHIPPCPPWKTPERQGLEPPSTREPGPPSRNLGSASVAETSSNPSFDDLHHDMGSRTSKWVLVQQSDGSFSRSRSSISRAGS